MKTDETVLIDHLKRLSIETKQAIKELKAIRTAKNQALTRQEERTGELRVGDRVRIDNPRFGQKSTGTVSRIGKTFVTITTTDGRKVNRIPRNVSRI